MNIYVASSWRNELQPEVVDSLRKMGHDTYDFKEDEGASFHWSEVGISSESEDIYQYLQGIDTPRAKAGFRSDMGALSICNLCVLLLPCGKSAHLELRYAIGAGKKTAIICESNRLQPELMYKMADRIFPSRRAFYDWIEDMVI